MEKEIMILVGPIGSGKTTFAKTLENSSSIRISQDEMGRNEHLVHFNHAIKSEVPRIIIDRMNFNKQQRQKYIEPARAAGYCVTIFELRTNLAVCAERAVQREDHPTIPANDIQLVNIIHDMYTVNYEQPTPDEYDNHNEVKNG